ncbi:RDD family protein [Niveibacterium sp. 24ML]|uniref:RDD family protein n=1 Tax=Niveibacterium sp. 24ML TaxID=2985512 RepID=UPI00226ED17F|nr:RDD family protein [Niveibacterium sp. 24ML]MCX9154746.1 RDD family protein [Niveibacterium sp. 24ML]
MLDTVREVSTPELIALRLHCAGPVPRALAWLIDLAIRGGIYLAIAIPLSAFGKGGTGLVLVAVFLIEWFYPVLFEVLGRGATPGKRALGLVVLNGDGSPVGWGPSLTRNLLRVADFLPFLYALGLISMLMSREFRRLGDIVADTIVTYRRSASPLPIAPEAPHWRTKAPLSRTAQRAVLAFAERAPRLSPERAEELAEQAPMLTDDALGQQAVERLYGLAHHLTGRER